MFDVFAAMAAILVHLQTIFECLFVLGAEIIGALTLGALQFYHVILRHIFFN